MLTFEPSAPVIKDRAEVIDIFLVDSALISVITSPTLSSLALAAELLYTAVISKYPLLSFAISTPAPISTPCVFI